MLLGVWWPNFFDYDNFAQAFCASAIGTGLADFPYEISGIEVVQPQAPGRNRPLATAHAESSWRNPPAIEYSDRAEA
jgi:hypothetical protein